MISFEERYNFYTNSIFGGDIIYNFPKPIKYLIFEQNKPLFIEKNTSHRWISHKNFSFMIVENDGYENFEMPCFQKVRKIGQHSNFSILHKNLNYNRHWGPFYEFTDNIFFNNKKNKIVWRGCPSGNGDRIKFCKMYYDKYDIGLSSLFSHLKNKNLDYLIKQVLSINEMTQYKYIISIEGNDKDSGINWKLGSNSVVIMKKPIFESWLMESKLIPWVHYVPLNDDMDNLDEIYDWCLNNDDKCKEIVKNANEFMNNFRDLDLENKLIKQIEDDYKKYVNFI